MASYSITGDADLKTKVRGLTLYEDTADELDATTLSTQIDIAKLRVKNKTDSDSWYSDDGLGQVLLGVTAILAKNAMENYSVSSWSIGDQVIDVNGAGDRDQSQFEDWNDMVLEGLQATNVTIDTGPSPSNTSSYIG